MNWRLAHSLEVLRAEVNAAWPNRSKAADGTIGDVAHQNQGSASDHNPWVIDDRGVPVVRAFDITADGIPAADLAERIRQMGAAGDPRVADHGYVIFDYRIASYSNWQWHPETGDPHTSHIHVSVSRNQAGYDDARSWGVTAAPFQPPEVDDMFDQPDREALHDLAQRLQVLQNEVWDDKASVAARIDALSHTLDLRVTAAAENALRVMFGVPVDASPAVFQQAVKAALRP